MGLAYAAEKNDLSKALQLLQKGTDPNATNEKGETPLFMAVAKGNMNIVVTLLLHSANPHIFSGSGMVPMDHAADYAVKAVLDLFDGAELDSSAKYSALEMIQMTATEQALCGLNAVQ